MGRGSHIIDGPAVESRSLCFCSANNMDVKVTCLLMLLIALTSATETEDIAEDSMSEDQEEVSSQKREITGSTYISNSAAAPSAYSYVGQMSLGHLLDSFGSGSQQGDNYAATPVSGGGDEGAYVQNAQEGNPYGATAAGGVAYAQAAPEQGAVAGYPIPAQALLAAQPQAFAGGLAYGQPLARHIHVNKPPEPVPVVKLVSVSVPHAIPVPVPKPVYVPVPQPVPIQIRVPQHVQVEMLRTVHVPVDKPYPVVIEKPVPYDVEKPYEVTVEKHVPVPVPQPYPVHVPVYKHIYHAPKKVHGDHHH